MHDTLQISMDISVSPFFKISQMAVHNLKGSDDYGILQISMDISISPFLIFRKWRYTT